MRIDPNGAIGMILTFLSVAMLITLAVGGIALIVWGAFVAKSVFMMACILMAAIGLPIAWLEYAKR